jgi:hypothetical protein
MTYSEFVSVKRFGTDKTLMQLCMFAVGHFHDVICVVPSSPKAVLMFKPKCGPTQKFA